MAWTRLILCQLFIVKNESFMFSTYSPSDPSPAFADLISLSPDLTSLEFGRRPHFMSHVYCVEGEYTFFRSLRSLLFCECSSSWVMQLPYSVILNAGILFSASKVKEKFRHRTLEGKFFCHLWYPNPSVEDNKKWLRILLTFRALAHRQSDDEGLTLERKVCNSLWWPISVINSVDNTKLPCYTLLRTQHHSFFRKLTL